MTSRDGLFLTRSLDLPFDPLFLQINSRDKDSLIGICLSVDKTTPELLAKTSDRDFSHSLQYPQPCRARSLRSQVRDYCTAGACARMWGLCTDAKRQSFNLDLCLPSLTERTMIFRVPKNSQDYGASSALDYRNLGTVIGCTVGKCAPLEEGSRPEGKLTRGSTQLMITCKLVVNRQISYDSRGTRTCGASSVPFFRRVF